MPDAWTQLGHMDINPATQEPYLRLPPPNGNIIITPPRMSDASFTPAILNDPRVYRTLSGPPYPYLPEHAQDWVTMIKRTADKVLADLRDASNEQSLLIVGGCPVRTLREVRPDGTDIYLGDIEIHRASWLEVLDAERRSELREENEARVVGDPDIVWEIGGETYTGCLCLISFSSSLLDYLAPTHSGRGVMTAALKTVLEKWAIPRMGVRKVHVTAFKGNVGSVRVFEKNGFVMKETVEDCADISTSKGGGKVGLHVLDWSMPVTESE